MNKLILIFVKIKIILLLITLLFSCKTVIKKFESEKRFIRTEENKIGYKKPEAKLIIKEDKDGNKIGIFKSPFLFLE